MPVNVSDIDPARWAGNGCLGNSETSPGCLGRYTGL